MKRLLRVWVLLLLVAASFVRPAAADEFSYCAEVRSDWENCYGCCSDNYDGNPEDPWYDPIGYRSCMSYCDREHGATKPTMYCVWIGAQLHCWIW